jgi:hypothetical protein
MRTIRANQMEEAMKVRTIILSAALILAGASSAMAATVIGRISYLYPDGHALILDSQTEYKIAAGVDTKPHGAAEFVRLTTNANNEVTAIGPGPADQAAYWVGRVGES